MEHKKSYPPDATTGFLFSAVTLGMKRKLTRKLIAAGFQSTQEQEVVLVHLWNEDGPPKGGGPWHAPVYGHGIQSS